MIFSNIIYNSQSAVFQSIYVTQDVGVIKIRNPIYTVAPAKRTGARKTGHPYLKHNLTLPELIKYCYCTNYR